MSMRACPPYNFALLMQLAKWRNEEWNKDNIKKTKKIQRAMDNIMMAHDEYYNCGEG